MILRRKGSYGCVVHDGGCDHDGGVGRAADDGGSTAGDGDLGGGVDGQGGESAIGGRGRVVHARESGGDGSESRDGDKGVLHFDSGGFSK